MTSATPFRDFGPAYFQLGWSPIPLPYKEKHPVPDSPYSYTGARGKYVTDADMARWTGPKGRATAGKLVYPTGNVALRLPQDIDGTGYDILGIDVDAYEGKAGAETLRKAEEAWGKLPATWSSSSKAGSPISGIRYFFVPTGLHWPGELPQGKGVELIRWDHRYAIVAPSIHDKTEEEYFWRMPDGTIIYLSQLEAGSDAELPSPAPADEELAHLAEAWVKGLTSGKAYSESGAALGDDDELPESEVQDWIKARSEAVPERCSAMEKTLTKWQREVRKAGDDGGAHESARDGAWALIGDSAVGHGGLGKCLIELRKTFMLAVKGRRSVRVATSEWTRIVVRGVSKVAAEGAPEDEDPCTHMGSRSEGKAGAGKRKTDPYDFPRNDDGNGQRLRVKFGADVRWCEATGGWMIWNDGSGLWRVDTGGVTVSGWAKDMVRDMKSEAQQISNEKSQAAFLKFVSESGNVGKIKGALGSLKSEPNINVPGDAWDRDERVLGCRNGVVELLHSGSAFRPSRREDYLTHTAWASYVPGSVNEMWSDFLKRVMPDDDLRDWVQKAVGYSLLGANPERLMFIVEGETSSGKSTFAETIRSALGDYAAPFDLNLFRAQTEQGSNVQLVRLMPRRFVVASEASAERRLHADQVKQLTGGDAMSARLNNANEMVERIPAFTPWLITNFPPTINGADQALWRRLYTIPFDQTIAKEDEQADYGLRLRSEALTAVLSWAVTGWDMYAQDGLSDVPTAVVEATMKTRQELSDFDVWLFECTEPVDINTTTTAEDLYAAYFEWCEDSHIRVTSKVEFGRQMSKHGYVSARGREGAHRPRSWRGIGIKGTN